MHDLWFELATVLLLVLVNGFFSLSEMALVTTKSVRLKLLAEEGDRKAQMALHLTRLPERFLSTVQIGITLVGVFTGVYSGVTLGAALSGFLREQTLFAPWADYLGTGVVVVIITFLTLVLGELVPKRLALAWPEQLALFTAPLMRVLTAVFLPVVHLLMFSTHMVLSAVGLSTSERPKVTEDDIRGLIAEGASEGVLERSEKEMLESIFRLGDRKVGAVMAHRSKVIWIDLEDPAETILKTVLESPFSRFPVAQGDLANIVGVVKAKELLGNCATGGSAEVRNHLRQPLFVPESMKVLHLLELFKNRPGMHFAIIVDEYGDVLGIVTLNDILESIVGDIPSPGEAMEPSAFQREDGSWLMDGMLPVDELQAHLGIRKLDTDLGSFQTVAGFVLIQLGRVPALGDSFQWKGYHFEIVDMDGQRLDKILVRAI